MKNRRFCNCKSALDGDGSRPILPCHWLSRNRPVCAKHFLPFIHRIFDY